jgi:hypothetical protein
MIVAATLHRSVTVEQLQALAARHARWADPRRVERAVQIVLFRDIRPDRLGDYLVESEERPGTYHKVFAGGCTCPDSQKRGVRQCKHQLAVCMARQLRLLPEPTLDEVLRPTRTVETVEAELYG